MEPKFEVEEGLKVLLACSRVEDVPRPVPGAVRRVCAACGAELWTSPGSLQLAGPRVRLVCAYDSCMPSVPLNRLQSLSLKQSSEEEGAPGKPLNEEEAERVLMELVRRGVLQPSRPGN